MRHQVIIMKILCGTGRGKGDNATGSVVPAGTYFYSIQLEGAESKSGFVEVVR